MEKRDTTPMTVAFVLNRLASGGAETQVMRIACGLSDRGIHVVIVCLNPPVVDVQPLLDHGVELCTISQSHERNYLVLFPRLVSILRRVRPDVAIGLMMPADILCRFAAFLAGNKVVSSLRNEYVGGRFVTSLLRRTDWMLSGLTTNTERIKVTLGSKVSRNPDNITVLPNALPLGAEKIIRTDASELRRSLGVDNDTFVWLAIGAQRAQKNYDGLIRAFSHLEGSVLLIAGAPYLQAELESLSKQLGLAERVRLLGRRSDIFELLSAADGFVLASHHEGLPNSVMEAMLAGCPVVATEVGGVATLVENGKSGMLVPPGDLKALVTALGIVESMSQEESRMMTLHAREFVLSRHDHDKVVSHWSTYLTGLVAGTV